MQYRKLRITSPDRLKALIPTLDRHTGSDICIQICIWREGGEFDIQIYLSWKQAVSRKSMRIAWGGDNVTVCEALISLRPTAGYKKCLFSELLQDLAATIVHRWYLCNKNKNHCRGRYETPSIHVNKSRDLVLILSGIIYLYKMLCIYWFGLPESWEIGAYKMLP